MMMNDDNGEGKVKEKKKNQRARTDQAQRRVAGRLTRSPGAFWGGNSTEMERSREAQSFEIATHTTAPPTLVEWALRSGPGLLGSAEPQPRVLPPPRSFPPAASPLGRDSSLFSCPPFFPFFSFSLSFCKLFLLSLCPVSMIQLTLVALYIIIRPQKNLIFKANCQNTVMRQRVDNLVTGRKTRNRGFSSGVAVAVKIPIFFYPLSIICCFSSWSFVILNHKSNFRRHRQIHFRNTKLDTKNSAHFLFFHQARNTEFEHHIPIIFLSSKRLILAKIPHTYNIMLVF